MLNRRVISLLALRTERVHQTKRKSALCPYQPVKRLDKEICVGKILSILETREKAVVDLVLARDRKVFNRLRRSGRKTIVIVVPLEAGRKRKPPVCLNPEVSGDTLPVHSRAGNPIESIVIVGPQTQSAINSVSDGCIKQVTPIVVITEMLRA